MEEVDKLKALCPEDKTWDEVKKWAIESVESADTELYVVYKGQEIVGKIRVTFRGTERDEKCVGGQRVYLEAFRVRKDLRNKGFGATLLNYVLGVMYGRGYHETTLCVANDNYVARHLYEKYGFTKVICECAEYKLLLRE